MRIPGIKCEESLIETSIAVHIIIVDSSQIETQDKNILTNM